MNTIKIMDSTNFPFEKNKYDTIVVDPPYLSEESFAKNMIKKEKFRKNLGATASPQILYNFSVAHIVDRIFQYAFKHRTWLIIFFNRPLLLAQYRIVWINKFGTEKESTHRKLPEKRWQIFCIHCSREIDFRIDISHCICDKTKRSIQTTLEEIKT